MGMIRIDRGLSKSLIRRVLGFRIFRLSYHKDNGEYESLTCIRDISFLSFENVW